MTRPPQTPAEIRQATNDEADRLGREAAARHARHLELASATGRARGGFDNAEGATRHAARQIVLAVAQGGHEHPDLGIDRLRELAAESEGLSGGSVRLYSRYRELEVAAKVAAESDDELAISRLLVDLGELYDDAMEIHAAAEVVRRGLPRIYGDPLRLDRDWPS